MPYIGICHEYLTAPRIGPEALSGIMRDSRVKCHSGQLYPLYWGLSGIWLVVLDCIRLPCSPIIEEIISSLSTGLKVPACLQIRADGRNSGPQPHPLLCA